MSPQIKLMIAIRLSWLCKLGFLGKRKSTYTCLGMGEEHTVKTKEREIKFLESLRAQFSKLIRVHDSQGSAIITIRIAEGRTIRIVRRKSVQQEGGTISKKEVYTIHTVLAGMLSEEDFCAFIVVVCYLYSDTIS